MQREREGITLCKGPTAVYAEDGETGARVTYALNLLSTLSFPTLTGATQQQNQKPRTSESVHASHIGHLSRAEQAEGWS